MDESGSRTQRIEAEIEKLDPWWAPQLVVAGAIALDFLLPERVTIGPAWLLPSVEGLLLVVLVVITPHGPMRQSPRRRILVMGLIGLVSLVNFFSLIELVRYLLRGGSAGGRPLIGAGIVLWVTNVLLFGLWYWELDRGGPIERATNPDKKPDFMFPQMDKPEFAPRGWMPGLIDYLYVSFTNATAFSPTDTMPLTQSAKILMSAQALASLLIIGLIVARAVNILNG